MMYSPIVYCKWDLKSKFLYHKQIEIYVDRMPSTVKKDDVVRIIILQEPHSISNLVPKILRNDDLYDYVFTYYEPLLSNKKAVLFIGISCWVHDYIFPQKEFGVSTVVGGKSGKNLEGHWIRRDLWSRRGEIKTPTKFYLSSHCVIRGEDYGSNLVLRDKKEPLFDTMFSISIENTKMTNVFSEKLIDCLRTKTVPIYYGAPNIGDYFDINGILVADSTQRIIDIANGLTPDLYFKMQDSIEANYVRPEEYVYFVSNLDKRLNETLNNNGSKEG